MKPKVTYDFNPNERAYPFEDGQVSPGIIVTKDTVSFMGQRGPIKEVGVNGCQIDDMIQFARLTLIVLNEKFPCRENEKAIDKLEEAEFWLKVRKIDRENRGVEGYSKK